jgi:predicted nuclease with TOPRIM domain
MDNYSTLMGYLGQAGISSAVILAIAKWLAKTLDTRSAENRELIKKQNEFEFGMVKRAQERIEDDVKFLKLEISKLREMMIENKAHMSGLKDHLEGVDNLFDRLVEVSVKERGEAQKLGEHYIGEGRFRVSPKKR